MEARFREVAGIATALNRDEQHLRLPPTRPPDAGFVGLAYAWAAGGDLGGIIEDEDMSGGDFVRNVKQLVDLLRQLAQVAPAPGAAAACADAAHRLFRGVVAASNLAVA